MRARAQRRAVITMLGAIAVMIGGATTVSAAPSSARPAQATVVAAGLVPQAASCCHITIPSNYVYNPSTTHQRTLHDYCSHSPDEFPAPGTNANFRGACARHDMCYQYHQKTQHGCDNQLGTQLAQECTYTYAWYDPRRPACVDTAGVYWLAVTIHTLWP
jgi:hypothetical protein